MIRRSDASASPSAARSPWAGRLANLLLGGGMVVWMNAYTPEPVVIAAVPGIVCWLLLIERCERARHALGWTLLIGAVLIGVGYRWLAPTMQEFGGLRADVSWLLTALFGAAGILHGWIFIVLHRGMVGRGRRPHPLVTVALLVACEHLPIRFFPWKVGHGAVDCPPLVQAAEWGGVSGVSFVLLCLIVPIHEWIRWAFARSGPQARPRAALATFVLGCALFGFGQLRYTQVRDEEQAAGKTLRVGIVQSNVGSTRKRQAEQERADAHVASMRAYAEGSRKAADQGAELIVWPETAITDSTPIMLPKHDAQRTNGFLGGRGYRIFGDLGEDHAFLIGIYEERPAPRGRVSGGRFDERYNAAGLRAPGGRDAPWQVYRKVFLIPFGEYLPVPGLDPEKYLPQRFKMVAGSTEGPDAAFSQPLTYKDLRIAPFLCYEGILPEHVRAVCGDRRPDLLVSLTNDSWFGDTWEPHQHLNFTRFRAVEHRAPLVRATNTGISAFVSTTGEIAGGERLGVGVEGVLVRDVKLMARGPTIYVRFGHLFPWLAGVFALLAFFGTMVRPPPLTERPRA